MKYGIEKTLLLVGCLLLAIGSLMLVSNSHAADMGSENTVSTSCITRATCLEYNNRFCSSS